MPQRNVGASRGARLRLAAACAVLLWGATRSQARDDTGVRLEPDAEPASFEVALDTEEVLAGAVELYLDARIGQLSLAFPVERYTAVVRENQVLSLYGEGRFHDLFMHGDDVFEAELDRGGGLGQGQMPPSPLPPTPQPIHRGERGGLDSVSCRSCHFVGGPDGAGSATQIGAFRGDGVRLSSASIRDAPHVMGLGYVLLLADEMSAELAATLSEAENIAANTEVPVEVPLRAKGVDFGVLIANPTGTVDRTQVRGVSPDLRIRPFGHKGRHGDLVALIDEALHIHHGLQSASYLATHADEASVFLGEGPTDDLDEDGFRGPPFVRFGQPSAEVSHAQAVLLATYLAMLPVPVMRPPREPELIDAWGRGQQAFESVGCAECHRPFLEAKELTLRLSAPAQFGLSVTMDLEEVGLEPRPADIDFFDGSFHTPIFAFTDFRRHDMGEGLAEAAPETLPDGAGQIPGREWLTRSLWGLADTAPYLHDGRAPTVHNAILWHGGEAEASRDAYLALPEMQQRFLRVFLMSLTRDPTLLVE